MNDLSIQELLSDPTLLMSCLPETRKEDFLYTLFLQLEEEVTTCPDKDLDQYASGLSFLLFLSPQHPELIFKGASLFYQMGTRTKKSLYYTKAIEAIQMVPKKARSEKLTLVLMTSYFEKALTEKNEALLQKALECGQSQENPSTSLLWITAKCWGLLGKYSGERSDFSKARALFKHISHRITPPSRQAFRFDQALVLIDLGGKCHDKSALKEAMELLKPLVTHLSCHEKGERKQCKKGWHLLIEASLAHYKLTATQQDFDATNHIIKEAILSISNEPSFWLKWSELYFIHALWTQLSESAENAIEKCSYPGLKEIHLGEIIEKTSPTLALMGLQLENASLIEKAKQQLLYLEKFKESPAQIVVSWADALFSKDAAALQEVETLLVDLLNKEKDPLLFTYLYKIYEITDVPSAHQILKKALHFFPSNVHFLGASGKLLHRVRRHVSKDEEHIVLLKDAQTHFEKAYELETDYETLICLATTYDQLGLILKEPSLFERAIVLFREAFGKEQPDLESLFLYGKLLIHYGDLCHDDQKLSIGTRFLSQIGEILNDNGDLFLLKGYAFLIQATRSLDKRTFCLQMAKISLDRAVELGKEEAYYFLGCLYAQLRDPKKTLRYTLKCLEIGVIRSYKALEEEPWLKYFINSPWFPIGLELSSLN